MATSKNDSFQNTAWKPPVVSHFLPLRDIDKGDACFLALVFQVSALTMSNSNTSHLSPRDPPQVEIVEIDKNPRRSASSPALRDRTRRLFLHQDHSSGSRSESSSIRSGARLMASWGKVKAELPKLLYTNMLVSWLLAGLVILPVMFASLRNSRALDGIGRAWEAVFSAVQDFPLLLVAGAGFFCGAVGLYWHCWRHTDKYVWLTDCAFL